MDQTSLVRYQEGAGKGNEVPDADWETDKGRDL